MAKVTTKNSKTQTQQDELMSAIEERRTLVIDYWCERREYNWNIGQMYLKAARAELDPQSEMATWCFSRARWYTDISYAQNDEAIKVTRMTPGAFVDYYLEASREWQKWALIG